MFYCNDCADKLNYPKSHFTSIGKCECCDNHGVCNDVPSYRLPKPEINNEDMYENDKDGKIQTLSVWDLPDTVQKPDGYDSKTLPESTSENMMIYMNKINELVETVNLLAAINKDLMNALK